MILRPRSRRGLANFTPIAGMGHLISKPKFKIHLRVREIEIPESDGNK